MGVTSGETRVGPLLIDLDTCARCPECVVTCTYDGHPGNNGVFRLREVATWSAVCRQCRSGSCIAACPTRALERRDDGRLHRYALRCIACMSCSVACPFGTILPELLPHLHAQCDLCADRRDGCTDCARTCPYDAIRCCPSGDCDEPSAVRVADGLLARARRWAKDESHEGGAP